ncbi:MAG: hypothetical protein P4L80_12175 [Xanthobacteraceae bacterium]|nr:hypothetical protein [Xanthobacteraceae bacterium]
MDAKTSLAATNELALALAGHAVALGDLRAAEEDWALVSGTLDSAVSAVKESLLCDGLNERKRGRDRAELARVVSRMRFSAAGLLEMRQAVASWERLLRGACEAAKRARAAIHVGDERPRIEADSPDKTLC